MENNCFSETNKPSYNLENELEWRARLINIRKSYFKYFKGSIRGTWEFDYAQIVVDLYSII